MKAAIVIPTFNEAKTIGDVVKGVLPYGTPIVVDDHSSDGSGDIAAEAGAVVIEHKVNQGYDAAIQSGFESAYDMDMDVVVTFDGDGQHSPTVLNSFLDLMRTDRTDIVLGIRPEPARFSERIFALYTKIRFGVPDILCGLKAYKIKLYCEYGRFDEVKSIGTELALYALRKGVKYHTIVIPIGFRKGRSRFGTSLKAELRIIRAFIFALKADLKQIL